MSLMLSQTQDLSNPEAGLGQAGQFQGNVEAEGVFLDIFVRAQLDCLEGPWVQVAHGKEVQSW